MKIIINTVKSFLYSILVWVVPALFVALLPAIGPETVMADLFKEEQLPWLILLIAVVLGIAHQLSNLLTNQPKIRRPSECSQVKRMGSCSSVVHELHQSDRLPAIVPARGQAVHHLAPHDSFATTGPWAAALLTYDKMSTDPSP